MMVETQIIGVEQLLNGFAVLEKGWIDLRRVEKKAAETFHEIEAKKFSSNDWEPLDSKYAAWKAKRFPGKPILRATDLLFNALTSDGGNSIKRSTETSIELGAGGEAGARGTWHQLGLGRLPQRKVIDLSDQDEGKFVELVVDDATEFAKAQGFEIG